MKVEGEVFTIAVNFARKILQELLEAEKERILNATFGKRLGEKIGK